MSKLTKVVLLTILTVIAGYAGFHRATELNAGRRVQSQSAHQIQVVTLDGKQSFCPVKVAGTDGAFSSNELDLCKEMSQANAVVASGGFPFHYKRYDTTGHARSSRALLFANVALMSCVYASAIPVSYALGLYIRKKPA